MDKQTKIVAKYIQSILIGLFISLILSPLVVNAETAKPISEIKYYHYYYGRLEGYHRFLPSLAPEELRYHTRMVADANIDDTPEKEKVVLIVVDTKQYTPYGEWLQAFLLIADTDINSPKKKDLFELFDSDAYDLEVPARVSIEAQRTPFVFREWTPRGSPWSSGWVRFKLVDLTGDGILDIWVKFGHAAAVISFQNGEFKAVFSSYTVPGLLPDAEYVDLDKDGAYEIKVPYSIQVERVPGAPHLPWMSLYEWNGNAYVLNNEKFYAGNADFLIQLLSQYNYQILRQGSIINLCGTYNFYVGLASYYRGDLRMARLYLQWVVERSKKADYIEAAKSILKKLPPL